MAAMLGIGVWFMRRERNTDAFFRGGQRVPWWAAGMSIYATMLSALTFMALPAKVYATDWAYIFGTVSLLLVTPLNVALSAWKWRLLLQARGFRLSQRTLFGFYLLVAGLLALVGVKKIKKAGPPEQAIVQGKQIPGALKGHAKS